MQKHEESRVDKLQSKHFWAYGVGHCLNDLSVSCYLNFLVFYLTRVVQTSAAPYVFLVGQITDGVSTPLIGIFSDRINTRIGKRMPWYIFGVVIASLAIFPLYINFQADQATQFVYYLGFIFLYSVSWASIQVSHMSLVPSLTLNRQRRDKLSNRRTIFIYASNFVVLTLGVIIFQIMDNPSIQFLLVASIAEVVGISTSIYFIFVIKEKELTVQQTNKQHHQSGVQNILLKNQESQQEEIIKNRTQQTSFITKEKHSILSWFKKPLFYLCCLCYVGARAFNNCFTVFLSFYLTDVLKMGSSSNGISFNLALVPLILYACGALVSSKIIWLYQLIGRKKVLLIALVLGITGLVGMFTLTHEYSALIYFFAVFVGCSSGLILNTAINLISEVVGQNGSKGAFVFGLYSFLDKSLIGLLVYLVTHSAEYQKTQGITSDDIAFIRLTATLIPGISCLIGVFSVLFYPIPDYTLNQNKQNQKIMVDSQVEQSDI